MIIILVGPSGSGKTTLGKELEKSGIQPLISYTTRPKREGEHFGIDYYFYTEQELERRKKVGTISPVEEVTYSGNIYGLDSTEVAIKLAQGDAAYFIADWDGAVEIKSQYPEDSMIFWFDVRPSTMVKRMKKRGDSFDSILDRMVHAVENSEFDPSAHLPYRDLPYYTLNAESKTKEQLHKVLKVVKSHKRKVK